MHGNILQIISRLNTSNETVITRTLNEKVSKLILSLKITEQILGHVLGMLTQYP